MTWRERTAAARERGYFTAADIAAYRDRTQCPAAEVASAYGVQFYKDKYAGFGIYPADCVSRPGWSVLWAMGDLATKFIWREKQTNNFNFNEVEKIIEQIEDRALELKRTEQV